MASAVVERVELAKFCSSKDWSKAIRILNSLLSKSFDIQDLCNRAFCYSQLELYKHVIKDCDRALQLDPSLLQAYILKGQAFSAVGRKEDAILVWKQGYDYALRQSADLKRLLELEELLTIEGPVNGSYQSHKDSSESIFPSSECSDLSSNKLHDNCNNDSKLNGEIELHTEMSDEGNSKLIDNSGTHNGFSVKYEANKSSGCKINGSHENGTQDILKGLNDECELRAQLNYASQLYGKLSEISSKSCYMPEFHRKPEDRSNMGIESCDESKQSRTCVTRISKTKSINVDLRLSRGISKVNEGKYASAITIFNKLLEEDPDYPEALIGRGTAYAFQRELDAAIADFTKAIKSNPSAGEAWKRRGQARAASGESAEAIADLTKALEFEPNSADILHERGIVNFKSKAFNAAFKDLSECVMLDKHNKSAHTYLGLALSSLGEYREAEEAHMKSIQIDQNFLEAWAHLTQFYKDLAHAEKALECVQRILKIDERYAKAYHLRGMLLHAMGEHRNAIKDLSIALTIEDTNVEFLYLRASCFHAVGEYREAVKDYDAALDLELDSMEKFVLQCMAFYQREIALYTASKVNSEFCWFDLDGDIDPLFKEYWCKRLHPKNVCEKVYRQLSLRDSLKKGKLRKQEFAFTKQKTVLLQAADSIGKKIQYHCPGFLQNKRQHRMAGLAAIEIAQKVSKAWRSLRAEWKYSNKNTLKSGKKGRRKEKFSSLSQNRGGAVCSTSSFSETSIEDRPLGCSMISWHDVYTLAVKWRQISEPCDPVVWINKLSEEFNAGFGSNTPLVLGQAKVVRYFPNFRRTFNMAKEVIKEKKYVCSKNDTAIDVSKDDTLQEILKAESCCDLYRIIGEDFWIATWCNSTAFEGKQLEGTRITLLKMGDNGFDFAIRTPCTPARWDDFNEEMTAAWEAVCDAYCGETYGSTDFDVLENFRHTVLKMTYYWYNFMPLSRGSAAVGFIVLLGLLLAANMEFIGSIPEGLQVDWEAILNFNPDSFADSVKKWLYPSLKVSTSWKSYPDVVSTFETTGSVVAALSTYYE